MLGGARAPVADVWVSRHGGHDLGRRRRHQQLPRIAHGLPAPGGQTYRRDEESPIVVTHGVIFKTSMQASHSGSASESVEFRTSRISNSDPSPKATPVAR